MICWDEEAMFFAKMGISLHKLSEIKFVSIVIIFPFSERFMLSD